MSRRRERFGLAGILILAALARLALIVPALAGRLDDPDKYLPLARALVDRGCFCWNGHATAYRPPLYPLVLAPLLAGLGHFPAPTALGLNLLLGLGTVLLTVVAAQRWGLGAERTLIAGVLVALDPVLLVHARSVMTETLAAFLLAAALASIAESARRGVVIAGVAFGLAALCRPSTLAIVASTAVAGMLSGPGSARERLARCGILVGMVVLSLTPWAFRNARLFGEPVWTTTHGGYTLALANNPVYYDEVVNGPAGAVWSGENQRRWWHSNNLATSGMTEPQADRYLRREALKTIRARPRDFLHATLARLGRFWGLAPSVAVYPGALRFVTALWTAPVWVALLVGLGNRSIWLWPRIVAPAAVIGLTAVHSVFWTDLRMRAPLVPALALIAASARWKASGGREGQSGASACRFEDEAQTAPGGDHIGGEKKDGKIEKSPD